LKARPLSLTALDGDNMAFYTKYLVCYDIENNRKRKKFSDSLKSLGLVRLQKSVFFGHLNRAEIKALERMARELLDPDEDKAFWTPTPLNEDALKKGIGYDQFHYIQPDGHITV